MFILDTIKRFFRFLLKPDQGSYRRLDAKFKVATFFSLLLLLVVFAAIWVTCYVLITKEDLTKTSIVLNFLNVWVVLLTLALFTPFIEELIFRLPLIYNRNYLLRYVVFLVDSYGSKGMSDGFEQNVQRLWKRYFWVFLYTMCLLFAFIHIFNYPNYQQLFLWSPILTSIQLLLGLIVSYLRIRFGFLWGWFFHGIYNLLVITALFTYVGMHAPKPYVEDVKFIDLHSRFAHKNVDFQINQRHFKIYKVDNPEYSLSIINGKELDGLSGYGVTPSRIFFDRSSAEYILQIISYDEIKVRDPDSLSLTVELKLKKPQTNTDNGRNILERELFKALAIK